MDGRDRDRQRFEEEKRRQREERSKLERGALEAFAEWIGETAKQLVKGLVYAAWSWLRGFLFG
jgi:hypothetical protein